MRHARVLRRDGKSGTRTTWGAFLVGALLLTGMGPALADADPADDELPVSTFATESDDEAAEQDGADGDVARDDTEADESAEVLEDETPDAGEETDLDNETGDSTPAEDRSTEQEASSEQSERRDVPDAAELDSQLLDEDFGTMAVPTPEQSEAVITVKVGGDRNGNTSIGSLAGVTLKLYDGINSPSEPVGEEWAECTSDADGDCSFQVPHTQQRVTEQGECIRWTGIIFRRCAEYAQIEVTPLGENRDSRFWVVLESAPSGWYANQALVTGEASTQQETAYQFRTGSQLRAGSTYYAGTHFMNATGDETRNVTSSTWQLSRSNPPLTTTCQAGIKVALLLDLSGSVANAGAVGDLKNSAIGFTEALAGTNSSIALYTFASFAPASTGPTGQNYELMPIDQGNNLSTITSRIQGYQAMSGQHDAGTNWDRGLYQIEDSGNSYDLAVVVTDGLPTFYHPKPSNQNRPPGPGYFTRFIETEQAVFSANALKAKGTRVLALGVGSGISGSPANLRAISGPSAYQSGASINDADYFQASWQQLAPLLEDVALGATCQASVTVNKTVEPYSGQAGPGQGWDFDVTRTAGSGTISPAGSQTTGADGQVDYTVQFDSLNGNATLRVAELMSEAQEAEGWDLTSVACTVNDANVSTTITNDGVTIQGVGVGDDVDCTFINTQSLVPNIELIKQAWDTSQGPDDPQWPNVPEIADGDQVESGSTITWTYTVTNTGETALENIVVTDDQGVPVNCPEDTLAVGASMTCWGSGTVTALSP